MFMSKGRNTTVVGVRLPDSTAKTLKSIARKRQLSLSDLCRSAITRLISEERANDRKARVVIEEPPMLELDPTDGIEVEGEQINSGTVEGSNVAILSGHLPHKDLNGNIIPESAWVFARNHRSYACPCGSGNKYKKCHGG
jgi:hypothetical protein